MSGRGLRPLAAVGLLVGAAALAASCGYRIAGVGGQLPGGISRVEIPIFENRTTRSDVGRVLTEDFINQLRASGKVQLAQGAEAQAKLRGVVTTYRKDPITFDARQKPLETRLTLVVDVTLLAQDAKRPVFAEKNVTIRQDYPVRNDLQENDRLEDEALRAASKLMSQKLVSLMLEGF